MNLDVVGFDMILRLFQAGMIDKAESLRLLREQEYLPTEVQAKPALASFKRGQFVVFKNTPGCIIQTENHNFDSNGVLLVVRVSPNTNGIEVTDENGAHAIADRFSLRHTPFASA